MRAWSVRNRTLGVAENADRFFTPNADEIYRVFVEHEQVWDDLDATMPSGVASFCRYPVTVALVLSLDEGHSVPVLEIEGSVQGQKLKLTPDELSTGHVIENGTWYPIEPASASEAAEILNGLKLRTGPVRSLRALMTLRQQALSGGPVVDRIGDAALSPLAFVNLADHSPAGVNATLYEYQSAGWNWLRFLLSEGVGGLLADEMGLGKTLQIICAISDPGKDNVGQVLIVAPGSILENWRREIVKFAPHLRVLKHHGPSRTGRPADLASYDIVVTSYDNAVRDNSLFNMIEWGAVVVDEAQYIRNPDAQRTRSVKRLRRRMGLAMTGTPVENSLKDLWSIIDFVLPGYLGGEKDFDAHFANDSVGARQLEPYVSPIMLRRLVADVAQDLPARIDIPQVIELEPEEAQLYDKIRTDIQHEYGGAATLVSLIALRQFCCHPSLLDNSGYRGAPGDFTKFSRLAEILEEIFALNEKVIIFTSFTEMSDLITGLVQSQFGAFAGCIDGRLPIDDRQPLIDRFSAVQGAAALILNPRAGGSGLNIVAANHVIHYNLEWNPALEDQASARAYRRGQTRPVTVHRLFFAGTVEEVVNDRLTRKRDIQSAAVVGIEGKEDDYADILAALNRSPLRQDQR